MNTSSLYKKYLAHPTKKETMRIKEFDKHTPIPTAIRLKTPELIQVDNDCFAFDYPINDTINTNFSQITPTYNKVSICPYFITTCKNRHGVQKPYLQYLLFKYPSSNKKIGNLLVFPFIDVKTTINVKTVANKILHSVIQIKIKPTGFIQSCNNIFVFYDMSSVDEYSNIPRAEQQWLKLIKQSSKLWWVLIDEICNHRKSLNFPIHKSVTNLFYQNPILIYLKQKTKNIDIPIVGYYGNYYKFLPIIASLGQKPTTWPDSEFGPHFYFTSYIGAFRYGGWTRNYKQHKIYDKEIAGKDGKLLKGGIIRFALFMKHTHVLLDTTNSKISNYTKSKGEWTKHYNSLYFGRVPRINGSVWHTNPRYIVKTFNQQMPISMHLVDIDKLPDNWDPLYTGYQIE